MIPTEAEKSPEAFTAGDITDILRDMTQQIFVNPPNIYLNGDDEIIIGTNMKINPHVPLYGGDTWRLLIGETALDFFKDETFDLINRVMVSIVKNRTMNWEMENYQCLA